MIKKNCNECGKEFEVPLCRKETAKYCSKICRTKNLKGKKNPMYGKKHSKESIKKMKEHPNRIKFPIGKENPNYRNWVEELKDVKGKFLDLYEQGLNDVQIGKKLSLGHNTISHWRRTMGFPSNYRQRIGITSTSIRKRMLKKITKCMICGFSEEPNILQLHHIDGNHKNNKKENLFLICPNCHELTHYKEKTGKYGKKNKS